MIVLKSAFVFFLLTAVFCQLATTAKPKQASETTTETPTSINQEKPLVTWKEFKRSLTMNNFPAPSQELAMFLAQVFWESAGLQHTKEIACAVSKCPKSYRSGGEAPNKYYYGRGYIQLTWLENYANCSLDMYGDMRLVDDPDLVSDTTEGAWGSAFWYWWKYVHDIPEIRQGKFGYTTNAINGPLECKGVYKVKAFRRFVVYSKVLEAFNIRDRFPPLQEGCYPMEGSEAPGFRLCASIGAYKNQAGMYHWCNDNCNSADSNCPPEMCSCEGGGGGSDNKDDKGKKDNSSKNSSPPKRQRQ
ncbi:hypothetical protein TYRP_002702 [Tyrophagus putrescentiae]|nr:hypothetical protein TYRP_002702 [Tyrophagus putrescentiae]